MTARSRLWAAAACLAAWVLLSGARAQAQPPAPAPEPPPGPAVDARVVSVETPPELPPPPAFASVIPRGGPVCVDARHIPPLTVSAPARPALVVDGAHIPPLPGVRASARGEYARQARR